MSADARTAIKKGSKSFYLASLFFSRQIRSDCWALYRWCRHCDDRIDQGGTSDDLERLRTEALLGLRERRGSPECVALGEVCERRKIPEEYPMELLAGFEKDTRPVRIQDQAELEAYAYQVAGVVGMMMAHIMDADLPAAARAAKCMGNAMQLTNIARDVREDFERGRVYLPESWLLEAGADSSRLLDPGQRDRVFATVRRLLARADELYAEGRRGLSHLPFRAALAVSIAASIYSAIGKRILRKGPSALDSRAVVPLWEKLCLVLPASSRALFKAPRRALPGGGVNAGV